MYLTKSSVNIPEICTTQDESKPVRNTFDLEMETINHLQSDLDDELDGTGERAGESTDKNTINYAPGTEEVMEEISPEVVEIEIPEETYPGGVEEMSPKEEISPAVVEIHEVLETSPEPMETSPAMESQQMEVMEIMETSPAMEHQMESQLMESPGIVETDAIAESDLVSTGAEFGDTDRQDLKDGQDLRHIIIDIESEDDIENLDENETLLGEESEMDQGSQGDLTDQEVQHSEYKDDLQNDLMNDLLNHPTQSEDIFDNFERDNERETRGTENGNSEDDVTKNIHNDTYKDTENSNENSNEKSIEIANEPKAFETTNTSSNEPSGEFTEPELIFKEPNGISNSPSGISNSPNVISKPSSNSPSGSNYVAESVFAEFSDSDEELPVDIKLPMPIIVRISGTEFLLVPFNESCSHLVSLFDDTDILNQTIEGFFSLIRSLEDLNEIHPFSIEDELVLRVPELKMTITEDNIYSREITIEDFVKTYISLTENTKNHESIPKHLSLNLTSQTRFITNFNNLSEVIRSGLGFEVLTRELKHKIDETDGRMDKKRRISFSDDINESL